MSGSKYDFVVDLGDETSSHTQMVSLVGSGKRVLDVGCATGYLADILVQAGNAVAGVEVNADAAAAARQFADPVIVGDLEDPAVFDGLEAASFDVVLFGDVLEHLRDPKAVLSRARTLLRPGGSVVISVPNIAHGDVRLSLLRGHFDYRRLGLLDDTHLRFFTRQSVQELLRSSGFVPVEVRNTVVPLFGTELEVRAEDYPADLVATIREDPDSEVYQFVLRAVPDDAVQVSSELAWRLRDIKQEAKLAGERVLALEDKLASERTESARIQAELTHQRDQALQRCAELEGRLQRIRSFPIIRTIILVRHALRALRKKLL